LADGSALLVGSILSSAASSRPGDVAVTLGEEEATFADMNARANRTAHALLGLGVQPGDVVAVWSSISVRQVELFFATALLGVAFAPLNPAFSEGEASAVLELLAPRLIIVDAEQAEAGAGLASGRDALCVIGAGDQRVPGQNLDVSTERASSSPPEGVDFSDREIQTVFLTSGTTALPKGVMLSHRTNWLRSFGGRNSQAGIGRAGRLCTFPLFHRAGWSLLLEAWQARRAIHFVARADGDAIVRTARRRSIADMYCIPAVWERVIDALGSSGTIPSLRHADTGTSRVSIALLALIKEKFPGSQTTISYGCNEAHLIARLDDWDLFHRPGSVGLPSPPNEIRLGAEDEIWVRNPYLMCGYLRQPDLTAQVMRDGWYRTGDIGRFDDEGYLTVVGRTGELIRTGGDFVLPGEVEQALADCPGIGDFAVIGLPDAGFGEIVCVALVEQDPDAGPTLKDLKDHVTGVLAPFKWPRGLVRVDAIPRTPATGKVQRGRLREAIVSDARKTRD
jgi:acyl-CoA synthetase (AMP-forming)/AMP-acid ligase II